LINEAGVNHSRIRPTQHVGSREQIAREEVLYS
jgi:hypothetical protein